jgi:hypothetical protein
MSIMKNYFAVLALVLVSFSAHANADQVCGKVDSISTQTLPASAPDYSSADQGFEPSSPTPVIVKINDGKSVQSFNFPRNVEFVELNLLTAAYIANGNVCYNDATREVTISH